VISFHFFAQLIDTDVDQIIVHVAVGIPNRMKECGSGDDPTGAPHQEFQQTKVRPAQGDLLACTRNIVSGQVQDQIAYPQDIWARGRAMP